MSRMDEMRFNAYLFESFVNEEGNKRGGYEEDEYEENRTEESEHIAKNITGVEMKSYIYVLKRAQMLCYQMILREGSRKKNVLVMLALYTALLSAGVWVALQGELTRLDRNITMVVAAVFLLGGAEVSIVVAKKRIEAMRTRRERIYSLTSKFQVWYYLPETIEEDREGLIREFAEAIEHIANSDIRCSAEIKWIGMKIDKYKKNSVLDMEYKE